LFLDAPWLRNAVSYNEEVTVEHKSSETTQRFTTNTKMDPAGFFSSY